MDLVRPLGMAGIRCAPVARPLWLSRRSRFTEAVIDWADARAEPDVLVARLLAFAATQSEPPVLFYEGDWDLLLVSRHRDTLAQSFRFVVPRADLVEDLVDKRRFQVLARQLNLPVPEARWIHADLHPTDVDDLALPVVIKPLTRYDRTWGAVGGNAKAVAVHNRVELRKIVSSLQRAGIEALAQELIPGAESSIESYHVYVDSSGQTRGEFTGRKIRTWPPAFGHTTALETTDEADVRATGRAVIGALGLTGVAKCDFKRGPDGRLYLLEVNPRFNLWHHAGAVAGVNLPSTVYRYLTGQEVPNQTARAGVRWVHVPRDARAAQAAGIPLLRWMLWAATSDTWSGLAMDDFRAVLVTAAIRIRVHLRSALLRPTRVS
jgi:predicted ATP-grasp superfamily ATP-dependent carboligase